MDYACHNVQTRGEYNAWYPYKIILNFIVTLASCMSPGSCIDTMIKLNAVTNNNTCGSNIMIKISKIIINYCWIGKFGRELNLAFAFMTTKSESANINFLTCVCISTILWQSHTKLPINFKSANSSDPAIITCMVLPFKRCHMISLPHHIIID